MLEGSLVQHLIAEEYTRESLGKVKEVLDSHHVHTIEPVANGLFAASSSQAPESVTGYQNVWIRDNVLVAHSFWLRGQEAPAIACVQGLSQFLKSQRRRFREVIDDPAHTIKDDATRRPHIRFTAQNSSELTEKWPHAQNDALGQVLWFRFVLANAGALPLTADDWDTYQLFPLYFDAIEYWKDKDSGAWEEGRKVNNSSVGAVVAGLRELRKYQASRRGQNSAAEHGSLNIETLDQLIAKGLKRLNDTLPFEAPPERLVDAALLSLIHPLAVVQEESKQDAILKMVQARLKGEVGIKRYAGDSYFCQDYDEWFAPSQMCVDFSQRLDFRDAFLQPNCEAQWCIFDPVLSIIYGQRYLANPSDSESFHKQVHYFNRSLRQITADGRCPELYFLKQGRYVANAHTPLAWTQANQALALHLLEKSIGVKR